MTRVVSGAVLILVAVVVVWFAPARVFEAVAAAVLVAGVIELVGLSRASGIDVRMWPAAAAAVLTLAAFALSTGRHDPMPLQVVLLADFVALAGVTLGAWTGGPGALTSVAASLFPSLYLSLPIGAIVSLRERAGPAPLFLLMLTVIVSDTAQYYSGRLFGRRPLAPAISPGKTVEGAIGGFVLGPLLLSVAGIWWLPAMPGVVRILLGVAVVALGIAGDLFESMLKRSAGVKDSSALIPGHGGVLDRIDALLFAAPVYYIVLQYI